MTVKYILGRAGTGKTRRIFDEIKESLHATEKGRLLLIVPEQFTLQTERDLIHYLEAAGIMRVDVVSFTRLAHNVFNEVGGITRIPIDDQGKSMMLRKIIGEIEDELGIYKKTASQQGFITKYIELLSSLKKNNVFPEDLRMRLEGMDTGMMKDKLQDIVAIYEKVMEQSVGVYMDGEDTMTLLMEKMHQAPFLRNASIWIDGFSSFPSQSIEIIKELMKNAARVSISLPIDTHSESRDSGIFTLSNKILLKLRQGAKEQGIEERFVDLNQQENPYMNREIYHLQKELYAYPYKRYPQDVQCIELFKGTNIYNEVEYMAAKIIEFVQKRQYRWRDIAIVCNDLESYGSIIKRTLEEYHIPYFLDQRRSIMHNPIIEYVVSCLETIQRGYRYQDVSRLFKTGFSPLTVDEYEKLEIYILQYGIKGNQWKSPFILGKEESLPALNESREEFIQPLIKIEKRLRGKHSVREITKILYQHLESSNIKERLEEWIQDLKNQGRYEYVNENTQIWNILMDTLDQLVEIFGEQRMNLKEYSTILQSGFSSYEIGIIPTTLDQVLVGQIQRSKSHDIKGLFVVGVNDGVLPSGLEDKDILSNDEKMSLQELGIDLGSDYDIRSQQERYLIYSSLSKPKEYLWLSYCMADGEGKALRPSSLIDRIKKIFPKIREENDLLRGVEEEKKLVTIPQATFKHLIENLRLEMDDIPMEEMWWEVYSWYYGHNQWEKIRKNMIEGLFHSNQVSYVGKKQVKSIYHYPIRSSVSRLEGYVRCPFAHFIKYGLRPKELKEYKVEAPDIGEVFHNSIALFSDQLKAEKLNWTEIDRQTSETLMDGVIDEMLPQYGEGVFYSSHRSQYLIKRLKRISRRAIWTLTSHFQKGEFALLGHEITFGEKGQLPAIEVELSDGDKVYLEGRIDRVDILENQGEDYIKIIDYKSGDKDFSLSDIYYGLSLQLMVYMGSLIENKNFSKGKSLKPAGVFYFHIDDPMIQSDERIVEKVEEEIEKQLKLRGMVLKDVNIVRAMDKEMDKGSSVLPIKLTKENKFYKNASALEEEGFFRLLRHSKMLIQEISEEMLKGNIKIHPMKDEKRNACEYCLYDGICQFDTLFEENEFHHIKKLGDQEVMEKIRQRQEGLEDGSMDKKSGKGN